MDSQPVPYPVNLHLTDQPVLVVGGGRVAAHKVEALVRSGARVTVIAPHAVAEIADSENVYWQQRPYRDGDAAAYRLVITATDDAAVNAHVAADGAAANVFVNSADDPANCTFTLPSVARRGDVQVAVSTNGRSPAMARWLRQRIEAEIDSGYEELVEFLAEARRDARAAFGTSEIPGWDDALNDGLLELVRQGDTAKAQRRLREHLGLDTTEPAPHHNPPATTTPTTTALAAIPAPAVVLEVVAS